MTTSQTVWVTPENVVPPASPRTRSRSGLAAHCPSMGDATTAQQLDGLADAEQEKATRWRQAAERLAASPLIDHLADQGDGVTATVRAVLRMGELASGVAANCRPLPAQRRGGRRAAVRR